MPYTLSCFSQPIKQLINNFESGFVTTIYGNSGSGKTTAVLLAAIACAKNNGKVVFVDNESGFNPERLSQLYFGDINEILDNIFLFSVNTFDEQHDTILKLDKLCEKDSVKLVVINSIGKLYRSVLNDDPKKVNEMMSEQMVALYRIARDLDKVVLLTNQVYSTVDSSTNLRMVGGKFIEKFSKIIIEMKKYQERLSARLIKYKYKEEEKDKIHPNINKKVMYEIKEKGLFLKD